MAPLIPTVVEIKSKSGNAATTIATAETSAVAPSDWLRLTRAIAGCTFDFEADSASALSRLVSDAATADVQESFLQHLDPSFWPVSDLMARIVQVLISIAGILMKDADISISFIEGQLVEDRVFWQDPEGDLARRAGRQGLVFMAIGWMTNMFNPVLTSLSSTASGIFSVDTEHSTCFESSTVSSDLTGRPIAEMMRHFGDLLPSRRPTQYEGREGEASPLLEAEGTASDILHVASINVSSLRTLGGVKVEWTGCISSHLDFDPARLDPTSGNIVPVLKIFRYPSLCYQHAPKSSILHKVLESWYDERAKPPGFEAKGLVQEILISYKLLVLFDRNSRKLYRSYLRPGLLGRLFDPVLDTLCLAQKRHWYHEYFGFADFPVRETFYAPSDFPIFSPRLTHLERFIDSIQPNRISSLWRDKRDILRWYTFWAVVILGGVNLLIALAQVGLGAAQVNLALKSSN
ncbi:hypothetical protein VTI28DRAFT_10618 [Corynascus sepedonium]